MIRCLPLSLVFVIAFVARTDALADWPMWRSDGTRSGMSANELPSELHRQWTRQLPKPEPAWPNEKRLHFDASYEPIVLGSTLFVGSMLDGSVIALDCRSGDEVWRFHTNGPVRVAPVAFDGRVCFGSDDGWLYCVAADTGELIWKVRGAPSDRQPYLHLGNAKLVSFWPVRGGPVMADGVVYFGAGIWPTLGVFVHAVDAKTGKRIWTNDTSHAIEDVRIDHNYLQESAISPQGHLVVQGDLLIVPNGRSMPARIDRKSGKLHYFVQGYRNGDSRVIVSDDIALVGRTGVINLKDGREVGNRWVSAGKEAPTGFSASKIDLFEGPLHPYKFHAACDHRSVFHDGIAYGVDDGTVYAYDLQAATTSLQDQEFQGKEIKPARWDALELWTVKTPFFGKKQKTTSIIQAGNRLYAHSGRNLFAVELDSSLNSPGKVAWTKTLSSEVTSMLAADDRLFVVTGDGAVHCFGAESVEAVSHPISAGVDEPDSDDWNSLVREIHDATENHEGYAIVMGLKDGGLVAALLNHSSFNVIAIDRDRERINQLRRFCSADDRLRSRFQGIVDDPCRLKLPPYIANLIVTEDVGKLRLGKDLQPSTLCESLRPYGGILWIPHHGDTDIRESFGSVATDGTTGFEDRSTDTATVFQRVGALPGSSIWSHESGDAARSFYSQDSLVRAPLAILWYGDGRDHGFYKRKDYGHGLKPQVAGGRLFAFQVATNTLKSVDAYTGRLLWSRKLGTSARYASMSDAIYVADQDKCLILDPENGEILQEYTMDVGKPADSPRSASDIRVGEKIILIAIRFNEENAISKGRWNSELLIALDRNSGKPLWSRPAKFRYNTAAIALSEGRVFCIDSQPPEEIGLMRRRGQEVGKLPSTILAIDAVTGDQIWKTVNHDPPAVMGTLHFMGLRTQDDWLAYSVENDRLLAGKGQQTFALNGKSGTQVWKKPMRGQQPLILGPKTFINQVGHTYDVQTGDRINGDPLFRRGGCNYAIGGKNLVFLRSNCATYVDVESRKEYALRNLRSGCSNSFVAADGLLSSPCFSVGCVCNYPIQTSFAMFSLPQSAAWNGGTPLKQQEDVQK